jgi:hypothetical protein
MFYTQTTLEGILSETAFAARTGDSTMVSTLLNTGVIVLREEFQKYRLGRDELKKISFSLETITLMQQTKDWVALADVLEYEFLPLWKSITESL